MACTTHRCSCLQLLLVCTLLIAALSSAAAKKIKGLKGVPPSSHAITSTRQLKSRKAKVKGPEKRTCKCSRKKTEVKCVCETRSGDARSESKDESGSKDSGSEDVIEVSEEDQRGIFLTPSEAIKDKIKYTVKTTEKGVRVKIGYTQEVESDDFETETKTEFEFLFENIVEYVKPSTNETEGEYDIDAEAYDWDLDTIVQTIPLADWEDIPDIVKDADGVVAHFTASGPLATSSSSEAVGIAYFNFTISESEQGEHITANSMKIDVKIVNFPWKRDDSYIALLTKVESKQKVKMEYDDEAVVGGRKSKKTKDVFFNFEEKMETLGINAFGEYTWDEEAEATTANDTDSSSNGDMIVDIIEGNDNNQTKASVNKTTIAVIATSPPEQGTENYQEIAYSFVGEEAHSASEIYWDPEAGIGYEDSSSSASVLGTAPLSLIGSLVGAFFYLVW